MAKPPLNIFVKDIYIGYALFEVVKIAVDDSDNATITCKNMSDNSLTEFKPVRWRDFTLLYNDKRFIHKKN